MDLNWLLVQEFNSYLDIRVISKPKQSLKNVIVRQFEEKRFETLLALPTPFIFLVIQGHTVFVIIFY